MISWSDFDAWSVYSKDRDSGELVREKIKPYNRRSRIAAIPRNLAVERQPGVKIESAVERWSQFQEPAADYWAPWIILYLFVKRHVMMSFETRC